MMNKELGEDEKSKVENWRGRRTEDLPEPPARAERPNNVEEPETRSRKRRDDKEVQYNVRLPKWLKQELQDLVRSENVPMAELLPKMLELYRQHRQRRKEHATTDDGSASE